MPISVKIFVGSSFDSQPEVASAFSELLTDPVSGQRLGVQPAFQLHVAAAASPVIRGISQRGALGYAETLDGPGIFFLNDGVGNVLVTRV